MNKTHNLGVKVLSLFDGMACGMLAMQKAGVEVDEYTAYEIDKYAIQTATHNFPMIKECRDVFKADFTQYKDIDYIVGGSPCFTKGTVVFTDKGIKNIEDIQIGDMVLTHKNRFRKVIAVGNKLADVYTVSSQGVPKFKVTANHPFYIKKMNRVWNNDNRCYDRNFSNSEWKEVKDLSKGDFLGSPIISIEENPYNLDRETCWLLGRYVADGHIRKTKRKGRKNSYQYQIVFSIGNKKVDNFKNKVTNHHFSCYPHTKSTYRCVVSSMELLEFIENNDFGKGAINKNIPNLILNLPIDLAKSFLDGYMSGDGCYIDMFDSYSATTISKRLAYSLALLIQKIYKTNPSITYNYTKPTTVIDGRIVNQKNNYVVLFKKNMRKQSVAVEKDNIIWTPYKSTEYIGKDIVYNISVDEDESYIANNRIVHNCTYWSIAQKNNRETEASGLGWELFSQYVRALREVKPKFFIYENNKSMSNAIRESITKTFGFEPICINSALVSAQNRQRLYWVGKRNADGTYNKVDVKQPEDRGILLKDILNGVADRDKSRAIIGSIGRTTTREHFVKNQGQMSFEPVGETKDNKSYCLTSGYSNGSGENIGNYAAHTLEKGCKSMVAEPVACRCRGRNDKNGNKYAKYECRKDNKSNTLDTNSTNGSMIAEPIRVGALPRPNGELSNSQAMRVYSTEGKSVNLVSGGGGMGGKTGLYAVPIKVGEVGDGGQGHRIYSVEGKSVSQTATSGGMGSNTGLYAIPVEFENDKPAKATSCADGKTYTVYEVKDGLITIKGKQYPIKLIDGYYIIRKLTVSECKRLQTVPEWYEFPVSDSQAYKMLGNGWTIDVIAHLIEATLAENT